MTQSLDGLRHPNTDRLSKKTSPIKPPTNVTTPQIAKPLLYISKRPINQTANHQVDQLLLK